MTQYEYFEQWFEQNTNGIQDSARIGESCISYYVFEYAHYTIITLNGTTVGHIDDKGLTINIYGNSVLSGFLTLEYSKICEDISKEVRSWYDSIMEKWYLNNFLNEQLETNKEFKKKVSKV
jgi:hypothetical protein